MVPPSSVSQAVAKPSDTVIDGTPPTGTSQQYFLPLRLSPMLHRSRLAAPRTTSRPSVTVDTVPPTLSVLS